MTKSELIDLLIDDLANEYKHLHFYLQSAAAIRGPERESLRGLLKKEAEGEFAHVQDFSDLIIGLGGLPVMQPQAIPYLTDWQEIIEYALNMEEEVIKNYVLRIEQARSMGDEDGVYIALFLEEQVLDSRHDADHLEQLLL